METKEEFEKIMKRMLVPEDKRIGTKENALWFLRNGAIMNRSNQYIMEAMDAARKLSE